MLIILVHGKQKLNQQFNDKGAVKRYDFPRRKCDDVPCEGGIAMGIDERIQQISEDIDAYQKAIQDAEGAFAAAEAELFECLTERLFAENGGE